MNGDNSLWKPDSHVIPSAHYISSLPEKFPLLRNTIHTTLPSESEYLHVHKGNNENVTSIDKKENKVKWMPKRQHDVTASNTFLKKKWNIKEKCFFFAHTSRVSFGSCWEYETEKCSKNTRSKKIKKTLQLKSSPLVFWNDCLRMEYKDISENCNDHRKNFVERSNKSIVTKCGEAYESASDDKTANY